MMKIKRNRGIATLPTAILIGLLALALVVSITSVAFNELLISQGGAQSSGALFYAELGARDALERIARNKNYSCVSTDCYSIDYVANGCTNGTDCSKVSVSAANGATGAAKVIVSKGIMKAGTRTIRVDVILDNGTGTPSDQSGAITGTTWTELTN